MDKQYRSQALSEDVAGPVRRAMRISILEGIFGVQYTTLTTATLLTGFLLSLGASAFQIGLVAMFPLLGGLMQPVGAEVIRRRGGWRKQVCVTAALVDDLLWLATLGVVAFLPPAQALLLVIGVLALQQAALAFVTVAWTSWMSDLIPPRLRGRFFGRRNFICNGLGAVSAIAAGQFIERIGHNAIWSFAAVITAGMLFRFASAYFLSRQPEPVPAKPAAGRVLSQLSAPLTHANFRRYLLFATAWGFSVQLAAPFFTVYMLQDLQLDFATVTIFAALAIGSNLMGQRLLGALSDRFGHHLVMRLTGIIVVFQPFWWLFTDSTGPGFYLIPFLNAVGGFAWAGYLLSNGNLMMELAPAMGKTSFFAVQAALGGLFGALGPLVGGLLIDQFSAGPALVSWLPYGIPLVFLVSFVLRLGAWGLLHRVQEPVHKPPFHAVYLIRDVVRTFNVTQGFSPLLHGFSLEADEDSDADLHHAVDQLVDRSR